MAKRLSTFELIDTLRQITELRAQLGIEQRLSKRHKHKGWSTLARPGALERWLRLLQHRARTERTGNE